MKTLAASLLCLIVPFALAAQNAAPAAQNQKSQQTKTTPPSTAPQAKTSTTDSTAKADSTSKIDPAKETAIRKLFEVQGTAKMSQQILDNMFDNMRPMLSSNLPPGEYREKLMELFFQKAHSKFRVEEMVESYVSLYDQYFTKEDIESMTKFYQTPLGQKMMSAQPKIIAASQTQWMERGQTLGREAMMEVFVEHPELQKAMEEASATQQKNNE